MIRFILSIILVFQTLFPLFDMPKASARPGDAKYIILLIGDGMGANHTQAANLYTGSTPSYQSWNNYWVTTYSNNGSYNPTQAWSSFSYVKNSATDSAAAATAMYSGIKTYNASINVSDDGLARLYTLPEYARLFDLNVGVVSSVYLSHATPGAWIAHNDNRNNGYAIANEGLWGDPDTTGAHAGDHGPTLPPVDVAIAAGYYGGTFISSAIRNKLLAESGQPGTFTYVERGGYDGGDVLLNAASLITTTRLAGLFGGSGGNLEYRLADGSGSSSQDPTLAEMASAALTVLSRNPNGFVLMIEGGAIDWAAHPNEMDKMVGEVIGFNDAVQTVIAWVDDPINDSTWENTLVIVTADHETGYLTAGPGILPSQPLGEVSETTLALEKMNNGNGQKASWQDDNDNDEIDPGETVYWAWNYGSHTNSLVPLFAKGVCATEFDHHIRGFDPVRGAYVDNTDIFRVMYTALALRYHIALPLVIQTASATP